jgi:hypothetical protein
MMKREIERVGKGNVGEDELKKQFVKFALPFL